MRSYLYLLFFFLAVIPFYGCDNSVSTTNDTVPLVGELDSNNTGANIDVTNADRDSLLSTLFSSFNVGGGIDFFYDIKNRMRSRDTTSWDTVIHVDSIVSGKSGTVNCSGEGVFSNFSKTDGPGIIEYDSSEIEMREVYYNYSSDSILFFGGESICKEVVKDTSYVDDNVQTYRDKYTEVCSLNLRFNGKFSGNISGTIEYLYHDTEEDLIDSTLTASLTVTSATDKSTKIVLSEAELADYLE